MTASHRLTAEPLPDGFSIVLDRDTRRLRADILVGGSPTRMLRLSAAGQRALTELAAGPVGSRAAGQLARRLTDTGAAHPVPPPTTATPDVTVIIPVRDRADMLARCLDGLDGLARLDGLAALDDTYRVLVVDDGSRDRQAIAQVCAEHGADLLRRESNGGPAAARNTGLANSSSELVAFLDSDCVPAAGWLPALIAHLADPLVAAVAPRIVALPAASPDRSASTAGRFAHAHGSLDLGDRPARVVPRTRVGYVPTAALVVRRAALRDVATGEDVFDPALRYGEDVDLIWRLHEAGWRIRYDPAVTVGHREPVSWTPLLARRFRYGTSAAPLAARHPGALTPLVVQPLPALTVAAVLARCPRAATVAFAASVLTTRRRLRSAGVPADAAPRTTATAVQQTGLGLGRYATQFAAPLLAAALVAGGSRRWGRRAAVTALLLAGPLSSWSTRRPALDPVRFTAGHIADDIAYGTGVFAGAARSRTSTPLRPRVARRPTRTVKPVHPKGSH